MSQKQEAYDGDGLEVKLNPTTPKLNKALAQFQQKYHAAGKDGKANYGFYTTLAGGLAAAQPATEFGLCHTQSFNYQILPTTGDTGTWKVMTVLVTTLRHESGEQIESHLPFPDLVPNRGNIMQALGSAITYARRYALLAIYGLAGDDDDADTLSPKPESKKGISRTPTKPNQPVSKPATNSPNFITPAYRSQISSDLRQHPKKEEIIKNFKEKFGIKAEQITENNITLKEHGDYLTAEIKK